jgi:hypothetical protein
LRLNYNIPGCLRVSRLRSGGNKKNAEETSGCHAGKTTDVHNGPP